MFVRVPGDLLSDERLSQLSRLVKSSPVCTAGLVVALWTWAARETADGVIPASRLPELVSYLGWHPSGEALLAVLRRAGYLDDWNVRDYHSVTAGEISPARAEKERRRNCEKQARYRARQREARALLRGEMPALPSVPAVSTPPPVTAPVVSVPVAPPPPHAASETDLWQGLVPPASVKPAPKSPKQTWASEAYWEAAEAALGRSRPKADKSLKEWNRVLLEQERAGTTPEQLKGAGWYYRRRCPPPDFPIDLNIITRDKWLGPIINGIEPINPDTTPAVAPIPITKGAGSSYGGAANFPKRPTGIVEPSGEYHPPTLKWRIRGRRADGTYVGREETRESGADSTDSAGAVSQMLG